MGLVCLGLADRLDRRAVEREDQSRAIPVRFGLHRQRRNNREVLNAAVDRAAERLLPRLARWADLQLDRGRVERLGSIAFAAVRDTDQLHLERTRFLGLGRAILEAEADLA